MDFEARKPLYFVGWNYHESIGVPLKRLLMDSASPFDVKAIVHQEVMAPEVDGIAVIQNEEFLALAKDQKLQAVLMVKDDLSRSLWLRRGREAGIEWLDEGELFLQGEQAVRSNGTAVDLGILKLPDAFDAKSISPLRAYIGGWPDATSNGVFRSYLQFLETGVLSPLRSVASYSVEHPLRQTNARSVSACVEELGEGIAWEIATHRSSFLEQVVLIVGRRRWRYAYSSDDYQRSFVEARILRMLLSPLGIIPMASWLKAGDDNYLEHLLEGFDLPRWSDIPRFVRIDVAEPVKVANQLSDKGGELRAWIRVGRTPKQLLDLLKRFPIDDMALDCDRPGPLGLQVRLRTKL